MRPSHSSTEPLSLVPSPLHARARKGRIYASGWNAIIGNSGVRTIETNRHFRTVCILTERTRVRTDRIPLCAEKVREARATRDQ